MIDSHAHITALSNASDIPIIIDKFVKAGGTHIVNVSTYKQELEEDVLVCNAFPVLRSCYGIHPEEVHKAATDKTLESRIQILSSEFAEMHELAKALKQPAVCIGETGYDIFNTELSHDQILEAQDSLFKTHIEYAKEQSLPIAIHARGTGNQDYTCHYRAVDFITKLGINIPYYFHSFAGSADLLHKILDVGGYVGINAIITYQNVTDLRESLPQIPIDRMLIETDAPFLIPSNMDRKLLVNPKINESIAIQFTAKVLGKLLNKDSQEIFEQTAANARVFFKL